MEIYLDYIFLENLIVNSLLIYNVNIFTKSKIKKLNFIIAVLISSIYATLTVIYNDNFFTNFIVKLLVIFITVYIAYVPKTVIEYIKKQIYYLIIYFSYVGIIIAITVILNININKLAVKICVYIFSGLILFLFNKYLWKLWKTKIRFCDLVYKVKINDVIFNAFVDTGNTVKEHTKNLDVMFLTNDLYIKLKNRGILEEKVEIEYRTATSKTISTGYVVHNINIYKENQCVSIIEKLVIAFIPEAINKKEYSALIGYNTYIENLGGVKLC